MKLVSIVGDRSGIIKATHLSRELRDSIFSDKICETLIYAGVDIGNAGGVYGELEVPLPDYNIAVVHGDQGMQVALILKQVEEVLLKEKSDVVMVYGDSNSTLAGVLAASKLKISVARVDAGLRCYNKRVPEEVNRLIADKLSTLLFCHNEESIKNLEKDGIVDYGKGWSCGIEGDGLCESGDSVIKDAGKCEIEHFYLVENIGDLLFDSLDYYLKIAENRSRIFEKADLPDFGDAWGLTGYGLVCFSGDLNVIDRDEIISVMDAISECGKIYPLVFPLFADTERLLEEFQIDITNFGPGLNVIPSVSYYDMLILMQNASVVMSNLRDTQNEACFFTVPCVTLLDETEWPETVERGYNFLTGCDKDKIINGFKMALDLPPSIFKSSNLCDGKASINIITHLFNVFS